MQISRSLSHLILTLAAIPQVLTLSLMLPEANDALRTTASKKEELLKTFMLPEALDALRATASKTEEFIKYLGIPNKDLCYPSEEDDGMPPMFNKDLDFGDMLLDKNEKNTDTGETNHDFSSGTITSSESEGKGSGSKKRKWNSGVIPYYISNDYNESQKEIIEKAISGMNSRLSKVQFRQFNQLTDKNYLFIFSGKGCFSKLGMVGVHQPVSLQASKCLKNGIIQHELTHAIGFSHEQNRPDRDDYIKLLQKNIPKKWFNDYERNSPAEAAYVGAYDYYSAMHYPPQSPEDQNKLAFLVLDESVDEKDIGNKEELSDLDVQKIDEFYGSSDMDYDHDVQNMDEIYSNYDDEY